VEYLKFLRGQIGMNVQNFHRHFLYHSQNINASKPVVPHRLQPRAQLSKNFYSSIVSNRNVQDNFSSRISLQFNRSSWRNPIWWKSHPISWKIFLLTEMACAIAITYPIQLYMSQALLNQKCCVTSRTKIRVLKMLFRLSSTWN